MFLRSPPSLAARLTAVVKVLLLVSSTVYLAACSADLVEKIADKEKQRIGLDYLNRLRDGDLAGLARELHPDLKNGRELEELGKMRQFLPAEEPVSTVLVGYWTGIDTRVGSWTSLVYQLEYSEGRWFAVTLQWVDSKDSGRVLRSFRLNPQAADLRQAHAFSFRQANWRHYTAAGALLAVSAFVLTSFVVCLRTRGLRRKWLWAILTLVSVTQWSFNWTTGEFGFSPIYVMILGMSAIQVSPYNPWMLTFGLPIGAIIFWLRRSSLAPAEPPAAPPSIAGSTPVVAAQPASNPFGSRSN